MTHSCISNQTVPILQGIPTGLIESIRKSPRVLKIFIWRRCRREIWTQSQIKFQNCSHNKTVSNREQISNPAVNASVKPFFYLEKISFCYLGSRISSFIEISLGNDFKFNRKFAILNFRGLARVQKTTFWAQRGKYEGANPQGQHVLLATWPGAGRLSECYLEICDHTHDSIMCLLKKIIFWWALSLVNIFKTFTYLENDKHFQL